MNMILPNFISVSIIMENDESLDLLDFGETSDTETENLLHLIPEKFKDWTFKTLLNDRIEFEHFRQFLNDNNANMDLLCWMDIESYRSIANDNHKRRYDTAVFLKQQYLTQRYFFSKKSPANPLTQKLLVKESGGWAKMISDVPSSELLIKVQDCARSRIELHWLPKFLSQESFIDRQKCQNHLSEVVEEVLHQRKRKSMNVSKLMDSKWMSSFEEIYQFRQSLQNNISIKKFIHFVSIKGSIHINNIYFLRELHAFKQLCHRHVEKSLLIQKIVSIISCFIESCIPPSIQIDITHEMAQRITERRLEASPYIFREAQMSVFRSLLPLWQEYCEYRSKSTRDPLSPPCPLRLTSNKKFSPIEKLQTKKMFGSVRSNLNIPQKLATPNATETSLNNSSHRRSLRKMSDMTQVTERRSSEFVKPELDNANTIKFQYSNYISVLEQEDLLNKITA
ncbi:hypothetical protein A3Q56_06608 [Intoshia linei]|uniref:RGS domain-containing protein n=1 Tax=Intoshia linei TaxID=1819745 RepID=A0A177AUI6_9BILA|nr:hypothetical protein A3Q56_06608 [Intoshia linei]